MPRSSLQSPSRSRVLRSVTRWSLAAAVAGFALGGLGARSPAAGAQDAPAVQAPRPGGDAFVILTDGTLISGAASKDEVARTFTLSSGASLPWERVSLVVGERNGKPGRRLHRGEDSGTYRAWKAWLDATHIAKRGGATKFDATEAVARDLYRDAVVEAVRQCTKWKCYTAAGGILGDALAMDVWDDKVQEAALASIPDIGVDPKCDEEFPFSPEDEVRGKEWAKWCRAVVQMGGRFPNKVLLPTYERAQLDWKSDAIVISSPNLELWSMEREKRETVCDVLSQGEATVRALESLLGRPTTGAGDPLVVRLLQNREKYLTDIGPGGKPPAWSGGFFSPGDGISRFYIGFKADMHETVSHELTHHWLERRFYRGGESTSLQPGYWIVEGFARFVEYQCYQFQKGNFGFDRVRNRAVATCIGGRRYMFTCGQLLEFSQQEFGNSLSQDDTKLTMFYEQSSALVFWLMTQRGKEGREALLEYMRKYYYGELWDTGPVDPSGRRKVDMEKGKPVREGWKILGFPTSQDMDNAFIAFLEKTAAAEGK